MKRADEIGRPATAQLLMLSDGLIAISYAVLMLD